MSKATDFYPLHKNMDIKYGQNLLDTTKTKTDVQKLMFLRLHQQR